MGRKPLQRETVDKQPSVNERIVMALLAPLFFNLSLLICFFLLFRRARRLGVLGAYEAFTSAWGLFVLLIVIPAVVGYRLGGDKCATLLGHFFYTNVGSERSLPKTTLAWGTFLLVAYVVHKALPHA